MPEQIIKQLIQHAHVNKEFQKHIIKATDLKSF